MFFQANSSIINEFPATHVRTIKEIRMEQRDWVTDQFEKLKQYIMDNLIKPITDLGNIKEQLNKLVDYIKEQAKQQANKIVGNVTEVIECFKTEADKLGINIQNCYQESKDQIMALPQGFLNNCTQCLMNEKDEAMKIVNNAIDKCHEHVDNITKAFQDLSTQLTECLNSGIWNVWKCLPGFVKPIGDLLSEAFSVAPVVAGIVADVTAYVSGVQARLQKCGVDSLIALKDSGTGVITNFVGCVKDKFPNPKICWSGSLPETF